MLNAVATLRHVFSHYEGKSDMVEAQIQTILEFRSEYAADKNGFVERVKSKTSDTTTRYMFDLVSTNYSTREMRDMAELYLDKRLTIEHQKADVLSMMATTAPAFGMFGTILGLIMMLKDLSDPSSVGVSLSLALDNTLWCGLCKLGLFSNGEKIKHNMGIVETRESVTIEGIILIKRKSELMIKDQLYSDR